MPLIPVDDLIRADLMGHRDFYASCILWSTFAVVVGCTMEVPEVLHEHWSGLFAKKLRLIKSVASIGLAFVVLGVAGELFFEHWRSAYEGLLQDFANILLVDAESHAASAQKEAANAATSAKISHRESDAATIASGNALSIASGARHEADSFERDIATAKGSSADANNKAAAAESHLAEALREAAQAEAELYRLKTPRSLTNVAKIVSDLEPFSGIEYNLNSASDEEAIEFTKAIAGVLDKAGWLRIQPKLIPVGLSYTVVSLGAGSAETLLLTCIAKGVFVSAHVKDPSAAVQRPYESAPKALQAAMTFQSAIWSNILPSDAKNVGTGNLDPKPGEAPMSICVGEKP